MGQGQYGTKYTAELYVQPHEKLFVSLTKCISDGRFKGDLIYLQNTHRLWEINMNTVPFLVRGRMISELILEFVNFFFKKCLAAKRHLDSHINAVDIPLFQYYSQHTVCHYILWKSAIGDLKKFFSILSSFTLFHAKREMNFDITNDEISAKVSNFVANRENITEDPVPFLLYKSSLPNFQNRLRMGILQRQEV